MSVISKMLAIFPLCFLLAQASKAQSEANCNHLKFKKRTGWLPVYEQCIDHLMSMAPYKDWKMTPELAKSIYCEAYPNLSPEDKSAVMKSVLKAWARTSSGNNPEWLYTRKSGTEYRGNRIKDKQVESGDAFGLMGLRPHQAGTACSVKDNNPLTSISCAMALIDKDVQNKRPLLWASAEFMSYEKGEMAFKKNLNSELLPAACKGDPSSRRKAGQTGNQ